MRLVAFTLLTLLALTIGASAQLPGIAAQNSFSFSNNTGTSPAVLGYGAQTTLYPTGGSFNVPNVGVQSPNGNRELNDVRVVFDAGSATWTIGTILYLSPTQINVQSENACQTTNPTNCLIPPTGSWRVQKKISGSWVDVSSTNFLLFDWGVPQSNVVYQSSAAKLNADVYGWNGSQYVFQRKTLDAGNNPKTYNGQPTIIVAYVNGMEYITSTINACESKLYLGGSDSSSQLVYGYTNSAYFGVQQIAFYIPSSMTSNTTISFGGKYNDPINGCHTITTSNTATIPNLI